MELEKIKEIIYVDLDICMTHDDDGLCQHYCYCYLQNDKIVKRIFDKNVIRKFKEDKKWIPDDETDHFD